MKKFLLGILIFTMAFNLVGGISSFAEEKNNSFERLKAANEALFASKDKLFPICFDKFKKKIDYFSFLTTLDNTNMNMKQKKKIQSDVCQIEHEYWIACKGNINKLSVYTQSILKKINDLMNEMYECPHEMLVS
ncbi:MAG: hypothetical protein RUMPE_00996 [Eubacteriales bacterium SKADARSKE-1]|nr:hypothetical protein [Eubacteriales bacterium SKADARSKE-1]